MIHGAAGKEMEDSRSGYGVPYIFSDIEQNFLVRLFILQEEAINGQVQNIVFRHWSLEVRGCWQVQGWAERTLCRPFRSLL